MKKAGEEGRSCSGLMRGWQEKGNNSTHVSEFRPRSLCIITIISVYCKESPLRPGHGEAVRRAGNRFGWRMPISWPYFKPGYLALTR
jgi:hypothetical protein